MNVGVLHNELRDGWDGKVMC